LEKGKKSDDFNIWSLLDLKWMEKIIKLHYDLSPKKDGLEVIEMRKEIDERRKCNGYSNQGINQSLS